MPSITFLNDLAREMHEIAKDKGWADRERPFPEFIALVHSELSEALEAYRNKRELNEIYYLRDELDVRSGKPEGIPVELADVIIRVLEYCGSEKIDIAHAVRLKVAYNRTREYRHGGKKI